MSDAVFPTFPLVQRGGTWAPVASTRIQSARSGAEFRIAQYASPRYQIGFEVKLREWTSPSELTTFLNFWTARLGPLDSFLYTDTQGTQRRVRFDDDEPDMVEESPGLWSVRVNLITVGANPAVTPPLDPAGGLY